MDNYFCNNQVIIISILLSFPPLKAYSITYTPGLGR